MGILDGSRTGGGPLLADRRRRVLVVEDHVAMRNALHALIEAEPDLVVCGEVGTVAEALAGLDAVPDLVLVDLCLGPDDGFLLLETMRSRYPKIPALVVSSLDPEVYGARVRAAGAVDFVPKHEAANRLVSAIRGVLTAGPAH